GRDDYTNGGGSPGSESRLGPRPPPDRARAGGGLGLRLGRALGRLAGGLGLGPGRATAQAGLERLHEVDDLGLGLLGSRGGDLAALDLLFDGGVVALADVVLVG